MTISYTGMSRNQDRHTTRFSDGSTVTVREKWTVDDAIEGLVNEWCHPVADAADGTELDELTPEHLQAVSRIPRVIIDSDGNRVGVLVSPETYDEGDAAICRINEDSYGSTEQTYRPFLHSPNATTDRLINTETLEMVIENVLERHGVEITDEIREQTKYDALVGAITFSFDPDSRGLMPVMTPARAADGTFNEWYWSFLYPTKVAGLFLRPEDDIIGGIAYTLVTGGGWTLMRGFWDRDYAEELAVKLAEAAPGLDWFTCTRGRLTSELIETFTAIAREHGQWRKEKDQ